MTSKITMHPAKILFSDSRAPRILSPVEHYAGNERFIEKVLHKQHDLQGIFDITLDLEDGASVGQESAQAKLFGEILASAKNVHQRLGVRVHDPLHTHFPMDVDEVLQTGKQTPAYWDDSKNHRFGAGKSCDSNSYPEPRTTPNSTRTHPFID